ncbi:P-type conjugative transfer protein TrbJ [Sphingobium yanoikuyae]|uniref:P-type conjugative transfer protein TrbJ n=1 Tax=Sphingobium yanoikuyae TaxID=13690 RepID=UPI0024203CF5|nr:P-type conjugative transfer protein TrbJ [Sphingobium yanoikuyae]
MSMRHPAFPRAAKLLLKIALLFPIVGALSVAPPAQAIPVFDSANYTQNLLTAARTLQQINQQVQSLQNEATMLTNMARNLSRASFPEIQAISQRLKEVEQLMASAQGIDFRIDSFETQLRRLYRTDFDSTLQKDRRLADARLRFDAAMQAHEQSMRMQSKIVSALADDAVTLDAIAARSQQSEGALQVGQATNQLLALAAKQQMQLQTLMAAQYRADAMEQARRTQAQADARTAAKQFLGTGKAYSPN